LIVVVLSVVGVVMPFSAGAGADGAEKPGLIGGQFGSEDFTKLEHLSRLDSLERTWSQSDGCGRQWSGRWVGLIASPADGKITFTAETDKDLQIQIADKKILRAKQGKATGSLIMVKGKKYPIEISYVQQGDSYDSYFKVMWSWAGQVKVPVPAVNLVYSAEQQRQWETMALQAEQDNADNDSYADNDNYNDNEQNSELNDKSPSVTGEEILKQTRVRLDVSKSASDKQFLWKADYFPSFADQHTLALWLFDETPYRYNTLTDAGIYEYDLRLFKGKLVDGKFGNALQTSPDSDYNLYYAEWAGKVSQKQMRQRDGRASGLWGPTISPEKVLAALAGQDWTIEFWNRTLSRPAGEVMVLDMGDAYDPGFDIKFDTVKGRFIIEDTYSALLAFCPTDAAGVTDGKWHHIAFTWSALRKQLRHYVDGRLQETPTISFSSHVQPVYKTKVPSSFVEPDGYDLFDKSTDYEKFRHYRFNLSLGEDRHGVMDFDAMFDEFRISNKVRYWGNFDTPGSFSYNYGLNAPKPAVADGPPLLFAPDSPKGVVRLGSRKYLFIDDVLLNSKLNLRLVCNPPRNRQELNFRPDGSKWRPSVVDVKGKVYMFIPESYGSDKGNTRLRISSDGLNFATPDLGLYEYEGSTHNDFIISLKPLYANFFRDLNPMARPEAQYKMTAWLSNRGIYLYVSPDGIHWRRNETATLPIISGGDAETYWDDQRGLYVTFVRRDSSHYTREYPGHGRACVYFATKEVFKTWPFKKIRKPYFEGFSIPVPTGEGETIFKPNRTGQVYRSRAFKYPWAPDTYLAFPWRFRDMDETRRVDLGVSRDGLHWKFYATQKWYIKPPEGAAEVLSMYGLIRRGNEIWQYIDYGGAHGDTQGGTRPRTYARVVQRLDGFVSLDAGEAAGIAVTRPLSFEGNRLTLNVAAPCQMGSATAGRVLVEIQDAKGRAIPGFSLADCDPIKTDSVRYVVSWKGNNNLAQLAGRVVCLKFKMQNAKLYALQFSR